MPTEEARKSRKRMVWIVSVLGVIAAFALIISGFALKKSRDVGRTSRLELCREEQKTRNVLRAVLQDAKTQTVQAIPLRQRPAVFRDAKSEKPRTRAGRVLAFYNRHLAPIDRLDCGAIATTTNGGSP